MGAAFDCRKQQGTLQAIRQSSDGARELAQAPAIRELGFSPRRIVADLSRLGRVQPHNAPNQAADLATPPPIPALVDCDRTKPGVEGPFRIVAADRKPGGRVGLLDEIERLIVIADIATHEPVKGRLGGGHQGREGAFVAARRPPL